AIMILLGKSDISYLPSEFRPIALGSTCGKIFFTGLFNRLHDYFINNNYIQRNIQKGFMKWVCGCLDHTFSLWETLKHAKHNKRSIVTSWIDLKNAYGSVSHNLIQYILVWYHVPLIIQEIIHNYYNILCAKVITKDWSTSLFSYGIGVFQGCPLSAILFNIVFNHLLDFLQPLSHLAYTFTTVSPTYTHSHINSLITSYRTTSNTPSSSSTTTPTTIHTTTTTT
ncbi:MAG: hypothetical protein GY822_22080, partial [Deltaproteobacteria bacterium]|nr:hypothetical protein [Deltaproteobacteria bacterium]